MEVSIYNCGDFVVYKESIAGNKFGRILSIVDIDGKLKATIQCVLTFNDLPYNLQSNTGNQRERSHSELWLLDQEMNIAIIVIELQCIVKVAPIVILYNEDNFNSSSIFIREILYKYQGHWKLRSVKYSYKHFSEFVALEIPETNLPIYKLYIDLYYDDFGTFRNVYHSLGGVYVQIGNLPFNKKKQLKNHFVIGFVPFGGRFNDFIKPFVDEMKKLEKGIIMDVQRKKSLVIASLWDMTADLPQGNDLAGVKRHSAIRGCCTCNVARNFGPLKGLTYHWFPVIIILPIPSLLDKLKRERHLQSPQDVYYVTAGKVQRFFKITIEALSTKVKLIFLKFWKSFEYPRTWQKLPNPISHLDSFMMSDCLCLAM
ncbi:hypothetical protein C2G38_2215834 [Gigaspora rosea]|uniref:Uncharacterized protein n=1 Tax=Gigaspora rosea TaxID=44941 RepID=A0A397U9I0_9GLOM|nr:hypothetical protein C2G38_2215834 [Gigaspora rosea]